MTDPEFSRISLEGDELLREFLELDAFRVCPLLETNDFLKLGKSNGIDVTAELLEQFEKKSLFYPLLRVQFPIHREKLQPLADGRVQGCGTLREGEVWEGRVRETYVWPNFSRHDLRQWMGESLLYSPETRPFQTWDTFRDEQRRARIGSYYSPFQLFTLKFQLAGTGLLLNAAFLADYSDDDFEKFKEQLKEFAAWGSDPKSRLDNPRFDAVILAQAIASRYYPPARGDLRTMTLPGDWDWYEYSRSWSAQAVAARFGISPADVRRYCEMLDNELFFADPLEDWDDLLRFVNLSARKRLKGDAQYGQGIRAMRQMFSLFFKDLTGEALAPRKGTLIEQYALNKGSKLARLSEHRRSRAESEVDLLEFVVNRYGLNPRPALVLFVEGEGEEAAIPKLIARRYGMNMAVAGIQIRSLSGVAGFTGSKKGERYGALEKVVEELHLNQTAVFVILDNEGRVSQVRKKLAAKESKYSPKRTVIRREFIHIWKRSIELDNFTPEEIAAALTLTAEGRYQFTAEEVATASASFGRRGDPISDLFAAKVQYGLPKRESLCHLIDRLPLEDPSTLNRPLLVLVDQIVQIAALNHKPTFVDTWFENQESGYLGHPVNGDGRMADAFEELRAIQGHLDATTKPSSEESEEEPVE
jgi:hypothetical protein